jgi:ADP-ribose diphosphatase
MKLESIFKDKNLELKKGKYCYYIWVRQAVTLLPITSEGKFLVMHEKKGSTGRWIWGFPGGIIEKGESASEGGKRECEEEMGLIPGRTKKFAEVKTDFPDTSVTYLLGYNLKKGKAAGWEEEKIGMVKELSFNQVYKMAINSEFHDPRLIVAILQLHKKVKEGKISLR